MADPKTPPAYPADHQVGMRVPKGGSDCAKCEYVSEDGTACSNKGFVMWNGSNKLPAPPDEYCCDFFEAKQKKTLGARIAKSHVTITIKSADSSAPAAKARIPRGTDGSGAPPLPPQQMEPKPAGTASQSPKQGTKVLPAGERREQHAPDEKLGMTDLDKKRKRMSFGRKTGVV